MSIHATTSTSQIVTLPHIPELFNPDFLDILIPHTESTSSPIAQDDATPQPTNPMIEALKTDANQTFTANGSPAFASTLSSTLDASQFLRPGCEPSSISTYLDKSWSEDPLLTLRIIWNIRSIHDGKSDKMLFYQAYGWLYKTHPRTAIENLHLLVEPVCTVKKGADPTVSHGYWKDLLNIVALAANDELRPVQPRTNFLNKPRTPGLHWRHRRTRQRQVDKTNVEDKNEAQQEQSHKLRVAANENYHAVLVAKLADNQFRALYIAVARLFAERLKQDLAVLHRLEHSSGKEHGDLLRQLSLAGKWAPTPGCSHDRSTNLSTAIALLVLKDLPALPRPKLSAPPDSADVPRADAHIVRSFYQRWILRPLRQVLQCPEPLMAANRWGDIAYTRVPSLCMKQNTAHFFKHDPQRFEAYMVDVESGKKKISGATLLPHEVMAAAVRLFHDADRELTPDKVSMANVRKRVAEMQIRSIDQQWKAMVDGLRQCGALENALAICDVSGSMGSLWAKFDKENVQPILPAMALSLVVAQLARPPFANAFITFSAIPEFVQLDPARTLSETVNTMSAAGWGMNTDLNAVFLSLLLPLAVKHNLRQEDMIKRLFVFSDMQFDDSLPSQKADAWTQSGFAQTSWGSNGDSWGDETTAAQKKADWETNHDVIEKAFKAAGYELPEIVYWNLAGERGTVPVTEDRKGVSLMSGFSPSMLKGFLGEDDDGAVEDPDWEMVDETVPARKHSERLTPAETMKKMLSTRSYAGLVVVD